MKYAFYLVIAITIIALFTITGCESSSGSESEWAAIDSLDFMVYTTDYFGYCCLDENGSQYDNDPRDWVIHDYDDDTWEADEIVPWFDFRTGAYPNPSNAFTQIVLDTPESIDITIVVYDRSLEFSDVMSYKAICSGTHVFQIDFASYDVPPDLYRVFVHMTNPWEGISKWSYGDIMYDPDYEWE